MNIDTLDMRKQIMEYWWLIALSISSSVVAQTIIKLGVTKPEGASNEAVSVMAPIMMIIQSPLVMMGLLLYGIGALAWIMVLSRLNLSYAYPFLALNFVLITLISRVVLGEVVPTLRWFGLGFICVGIFLVSRSSAG